MTSGIDGPPSVEGRSGTAEPRVVRGPGHDLDSDAEPAAEPRSDPDTERVADAVFDVDASAAEALGRVRGDAVRRGLRPGIKPKPRRRRGEPATYSVDGGRDPHALGDEVEALTRQRGWGVDVAAGSIMGRWPQIVGPDVAAHTTPVTFTDGVLTVRADSTAWAGNLRLMSSMLLGRLAEEAGADTVHEVRVVGPSAPSWNKGPRRSSYGRGPRDTYG